MLWIQWSISGIEHLFFKLLGMLVDNTQPKKSFKSYLLLKGLSWSCNTYFLGAAFTQWLVNAVVGVGGRHKDLGPLAVIWDSFQGPSQFENSPCDGLRHLLLLYHNSTSSCTHLCFLQLIIGIEHESTSQWTSWTQIIHLRVCFPGNLTCSTSESSLMAPSKQTPT